jgi:hypothetical protein
MFLGCRCSRGIPHGQENRFCCSGISFVCGRGSNVTVSGVGGGGGKVSGNDSGKRIDCAWVNDDCADCPDGSDEPGTSAASHLVSFFTIGNVKQPQVLLCSIDHDCVATSSALFHAGSCMACRVTVSSRHRFCCSNCGDACCHKRRFRACSSIRGTMLQILQTCRPDDDRALCRAHCSLVTTAKRFQHPSWTTESATAAMGQTSGRQRRGAGTAAWRRLTRSWSTFRGACPRSYSRIVRRDPRPLALALTCTGRGVKPCDTKLQPAGDRCMRCDAPCDSKETDMRFSCVFRSGADGL